MKADVKKITGRNARIKKSTFSIVPYSPLFVGSGNKLKTGLDFFCSHNKTFLFDHKKIYGQFLEHLDELDKAVMDSALPDFITRKGLNPNDFVKKVIAGDVKGTELLEPLTDGFVNPIIPGSSIKGSLRTAIFVDRFLKKGYSLSDYEGKIAGKKVSSQNLEEDLLTTYNRSKKGSSPNYDIGRVIRVGDATFRLENLEVFNSVVANETNEGFQWKKLGRGQHNEKVSLSEATYLSMAAISYDEVTTSPVPFSISLDMQALESIEWREELNFKTIAKACNQVSSKIVQHDLDYLKEAQSHLPGLETVIGEYEDLLDDVKYCMKENEAGRKISWIQRIGWGSGWLSMTGAHAYESAANRIEYIEALKRKAPYMFRKTGRFEYPKTRKIVLDIAGKPATGMGWVLVQEL